MKTEIVKINNVEVCCSRSGDDVFVPVKPICEALQMEVWVYTFYKLSLLDLRLLKSKKEGSVHIVRFENGDGYFYLASCDGDQGRTLHSQNAKKFKTAKLAEKALKKAFIDYPERDLVGTIIEYNPNN